MGTEMEQLAVQDSLPLVAVLVPSAWVNISLYISGVLYA